MPSLEMQKALDSYENHIRIYGIDREVVDAYHTAVFWAAEKDKDIETALQTSKRTKELINQYIANGTGENLWKLEKFCFQNKTWHEALDKYYEILKFEAPHRLESFALYMEKNRPPEERFYQPRMNPLRQIAQLIQDLYDDKLDEGMVFCPGRIGKTQMIKVGKLWFGSNRPERANLYSAYSDKITGGFYDGIIELITDPTYTYAEIFPQNVEKKLITDGKDLTIDLIRKKTYPTFTMRSIYGTLNGACDCDGLGVYDDLFSGIDEALSEDRQRTVWGKFDNNFMPRIKPGKAKLLGIGTRWAPKDVQGRRLELLMNDPDYAGVRHREVIIPALNENGESNFDYPYKLGYTTLDYKRRMASFESNDDMASWFAQYQQEPVERRGLLFPPESVLTFNPEIDLPDREPDRILAAVDEAFGGGDYVAMPVCYQYDNDFFIVDVVFNKGDKKITRPLIVEMCMKYKVRTIRFEETKTTADYREWCESEWKDKGFSINSFGQAAPNNIAKKDRIFNKAPEIGEMRFLESRFRSNEYNAFMKNMREFKMEGRVKHDDAPDSMSQLCEMKFERKRNSVEAIQNPFRTGGRGYGF